MNYLTRLFKNAPAYDETVPYIPPVKTGHVIKVYDGDTITIATSFSSLITKTPLYRFPVRLRGIDCPEIKGTTNDEKEIALIAKAELESLIYGKKVTLKNVATDKYGRLLADVYLGNTNLTTHMLDKRLAVPYFGKTKQPPSSWRKYYENTDV